MATKTSRRSAVLDLLSDGKWHSTVEISGLFTGGSEGTRRLRELRARGYAINGQKILGMTQWEYRWVNRTWEG